MKKWPISGLVAVIVVYTIFAIAFSRVTPFNKGPDEGSNLSYIKFIVANNRLPITYDEREQVGADGNQPALYHLMVAGLSKIMDVDVEAPPYIKIFWDSFRYRAIDIGAESTWYLPAEDQNWPYYGVILSLQLGRWLSVFTNIVTLLLVYLVALEFFPNREWLALTAVALPAFTPTFIFMSSVLNEDALVAATSTLYFLSLIKVIKQPHALRGYLVMGLAMGVSVTAKYTTLILPLETVLVFTALARYNGYNWRWLLKYLVVVGGCAILASSWWFAWNLWYLNTVDETGWLSGLLTPFATGGSDITLARVGYFFSGGQTGVSGISEGRQPGSFTSWTRTTFYSFWGVSIGGVRPLFYYAYGIITLMLATTVFGLYRLWRRERHTRKWILLMIFHTGIFFIFPLLRFWLSRRIGETAQGRHILIPAAAAVVVLIVWGVSTALTEKWQRWVFPIIVAGLLIWTGAHVHRLATAGGRVLPLRTQPEAAAWFSTPVNARFGEEIELASYDLSLEPEQGLMRLNLGWRALEHISENYLLGVDVVDAQGQSVSHWVGYNGDGRLPTLAWDPGDSVFDRLALPLPNLAAGDYQLQIQMMSSTGPLPINDIKDALLLGQFTLNEPAESGFDHRISVGAATGGEIKFALWNSDGPVETGVMPAYRYPATISIIFPDSADENLRVQLVDPDGQLWPPTEARGNVNNFVIGPRWQSGTYRLQLSPAPGDEVASSPLLTVENWWPRQFQMPDIENPVTANFANQVNLLGYKLPQNQVKAGDSFPVTLYWQAPADKSPQANFIQFNNVLDIAGAQRGGYDRRPLEYYSTLLWAPGEIVVDGYAVPVDPDAPPGEYFLDVGYYIIVGESAVNLPLVVDGKMTGVSSVTIGPVQVISP